MVVIDKNGQKWYTRFCIKCKKKYHSKTKLSKVCADCDKSAGNKYGKQWKVKNEIKK